jgi:hypothetical protein
VTAGGPVEIGRRLFRYRSDAGVEWLFHANLKSRSAFENIRHDDLVRRRFVFKLFIIVS